MNIKRILIVAGLVVGLQVCVKATPQMGWREATRTLQPVEDGSIGTSQTLSLLGGGGTLDLQGYSTIAETITPEIQALARGLENDPLRIFNYVHDHIRHVLYFGATKGAQLTLLERSGNDFDQCALLVALLRAAGQTNVGYQFGMLKMPYENTNHDDLRHWLQLSFPNTNYSATVDYFANLTAIRGYPTFVWFDDNSSIALHRVWVKLTMDATDYYLDPAFKISEPVTGIDLAAAMGLNTNDLVSAAGGTNTADYVQNVNEAAVRNKLRDYTTNFLATLQSNHPNASVAEILGGWRIVPSTNTTLSQSLLFPNYDASGQLPVLDWTYQPTNLMSSLTMTLAGTNYLLYFPALQGQRLALTFDASGVGQLWLEDTLLVQRATGGADNTTNVTWFIHHPHGDWDYANNTLIDQGYADDTATISYQRRNSTSAQIYAFDAHGYWLRQRQKQLDAYRQLGLTNLSRQVLSETLNVMGLSWYVQTEGAVSIVATEMNVLRHYLHRFGRMTYESGNGYFIDAFKQLSAGYPADGNSVALVQEKRRAFDLSPYFESAFEHGIIEQTKTLNLVGASTVKMLQLANTNALKIFLATSNNWIIGANVRSQLTNYDSDLSFFDEAIDAGFTIFLPRDGYRPVAGASSWAGYGAVLRRQNSSGADIGMFVYGGYNGGFSSDENATPDSEAVSQWGNGQQQYFDPNSPFNPWGVYGADPVNMANGSFTLDGTDLALGQSPPKGFAFSRHYSSARRDSNPAGLAYGWTHNWYFRLAEIAAAEAGLGDTTPQQMAATIVATRAAVELYRNDSNPKNWLLTALIAKWGIDQIINNSVSVTLGKDTVQFIKQPDNSFTPPANCKMTLLKTNSVYWLQERHGNIFKFDTAGRMTNIVDQYNQSLRLTYGTGASSNWVTQLADWKNRTLTLAYSGTPLRLTSITDNASPNRTVSFGYTTNAGQLDLASVTDAENKTSTFQYDTNHQMLAVKDALGQLVTTNIYDGFGRVVTQLTEGDTNKIWHLYWSGLVNVEQDPAGNKRRFFYDDKSRLVALADALGNVSQNFYDGQDHVVMTVSPLNETNRFEFDGRHNLLHSIDPLNFTNRLVYDSQYRLTSTVDARGNTNRFGFNTQHSLIGQTNAAGEWITFGYNADGTFAGRTNAGGATAFGYDANGYVNRITHPGGLGVEGFLNGSRGDVLSRTNARGFVTSFQYNQHRELTNTIAPTNLTARISFDAVGNVQSATDARGFTRSQTWSATQKLLATTWPGTPQGVPVVTNVYDRRDWLARTINPLQQTVSFTNDAAQRLVSVTDPLNRTMRFAHDAVGRQLAATNAANEVTRQSWNARGELTQSVDGAGHAVLRAFDAAGNQVALTNRNGKRWQFQFDAANRLTNTITPLGRETRVTYDSRGLVSTMREPSAQTTTNFYDAKGRLTNSADAVASRLLRYDANDNVTNLVENGRTNAWTFDAYDRVSSYRDADGNLIQYRHDANGNLTNLIYPGNRVVNYAYDSLNRLTNITDWAGRQTRFTYDLANRLTSLVRPNGTVREIAYDAAGQTTNIWEQTTGGTPIARFKFNWNNSARIGWEFAAPLPHAYTPPARTMTFDDDNRLATFNGLNVTHDLDGNMTSGPLTNNTFATYAYDARNRLSTFNHQLSTTAYGYDPAGNRTAITNGASVTRFVINPNAPLSQVLIRINGGITNYYIYGLGLQYEITETATSTNTLTYHFDFRGSTVALTDNSGNVTDRIEYSPYGTTTYRSGTNDTPFLFNGRYGVQTDANGLLYMRARYYNPHICRFINADPSGFEGGLNFYAYADGNPVSLIDPFGLGAQMPQDNSWFGKFDRATDAVGGAIETGVKWTVKTGFKILGGLFDKPHRGGGVDSSSGAVSWLLNFLIGKGSGTAVKTTAAETVTSRVNILPSSGNRFVVSPGGDAIIVPQGASGPVLIINQGGRTTGFGYTGGSGGLGLDLRVSNVRIMDATLPRGPSPGYPAGYVNYQNIGGQSVNPFTGQTIAPNNPLWHISLTPP